MTRPQELLAVLRTAVSEAVSGETVIAVSYSGGLDSSVIAALASEVCDVRAYSCATEGSFDARNVERCAQEEHLTLTMIRMTPADVAHYVKRTASVLGSLGPVPIAYTLPILRVLDECSERTVLLGSGADELFGGYAKYSLLPEPEAAMAKDLSKMESELRLMGSYAETKGKRLASPFTARPVIDFASALPTDRKISKDARKIVLREAAAVLRLPSSTRPKKAAQYSSGILREMQRQAKAARLTLGEWTARISAVHR